MQLNFSAFARWMTSRIPASDRSAAMPGMSLGERLRRPLLVAFPILLAVVGAAYYLAEEPYVSTDDAFVRAAKESINARVAGQAVEIAVQDNQRVRKGQLLFQIDPEPYQIAVDQAEARLGSARLQIDALKATYRQQLAELQSAKDSADFDEREYARKKALVAGDWTPRAVYERAERDLKVARQHIASIEQQIAGTVVALNGDPNIEIDRHPTVRAVRLAAVLPDPLNWSPLRPTRRVLARSAGINSNMPAVSPRCARPPG